MSIDLDISGLLGGRTEVTPAAPAPGSGGAAAPTPPADGMPRAGRDRSAPVPESPPAEPAPETGPAGAAPRLPALDGDALDAIPVPDRLPPATREPEPEQPAGPISADDLDAIRWRLDGGTLREVVDDLGGLRELGERLDEPLAGEVDNAAKSGLLSVRAEVYRLLGELGMAAAASRLALAHAEAARDVPAIVVAQAELAHVLRLRGDFIEADRLFEQAASSEAPEPLRSVVHENAGRSCFDQGRHMEALDHFARAVRLAPPDDVDLAERIDVSLEAVYIHVLRDGWGPYPRLRREILGPGRT